MNVSYIQTQKSQTVLLTQLEFLLGRKAKQNPEIHEWYR